MGQKRTLSKNQDMAANPTENVWVQANAGTGKTSVLVQRLLRILFRTENLDKAGILCLTYTNAGAGEMKNRILKSLRDWATASDEELRDLLYDIAENKEPTQQDLAHAREIFFWYIDNQDVLKIKTIHGFCEEILRRFPLEAGISPNWTLVSDSTQKVLLQEAFETLVNSKTDTVLTDAFSRIVNRVSETRIDDLLNILSEQYKYFFQVIDYNNYRKYFIDTTRLFLDINTPHEYTFSKENLEIILENANNDIKNTKNPAQYIINVINLTKQYIDKTIDFDKYKKAYLKDDGNKIANVSKKDYLIAEQDKIYKYNQYILAKGIFEDTLALFDLSAAFSKVYKTIKSKRNALDFEDLILYTKKLFSSRENMGWVLSQLDKNLTHILVDEAQDTSPVQWDILRMLSGDFFTDGDDKKLPHSLFVVGDTKQSIYGFQGADPRAFAKSREEISAQIKQNLRTIKEIPLEQSFRSLSPILKAVDTFFDNREIQDLTGFKNNTHVAFRKTSGGLVEIHKLISKQSDDTDVLEYINVVADKIKELIESGFKSSDIMVLVQNRNPMASPLVKELKKRGLTVAGSDRIILPKFPAIRDLLNLVRFCLNTSDDYSLCCVLKSPIFRLKEHEIFNICQIKNNENNTRKKQDKDYVPMTVFDALKDTRSDIYARLNDLISKSNSLAPYSFFSYLLNTNGVRDSMISALGNQIIDPLEEFMTICLSYERTQTGTLKHFLKWFITGGSEIKRDMDASSGIRVVTVHGSKGLEAPVVFLIDTVKIPKDEQILTVYPEILPTNVQNTGKLYPPIWLWTPQSNTCSQCDVAVNAVMKTKIAEYYRLLYVAMTRARDRLYIYGYTPYKNAPENSWHQQLWNVFAKDENVETIRITDDK